MSSLDQSTVAKIKSTLFGKKSEEIIETRIKPTVIRRRRRAVELDTVAETEAQLEESSLAEAPLESQTPSVTAPAEDTQDIAPDAEVAEEKTPATVTTTGDAAKEKIPLEVKEPAPQADIPEAETKPSARETLKKQLPPPEVEAKKQIKRNIA